MLEQAGVVRPAIEARWLVLAHQGCDASRLVAADETVLDDPELFRERLEERRRGKPLARIFGRRGFWQDDFGIDAHVLDPRPDSEWLLEAARRLIDTPPRRLLDLGTGSGCLLLSLLRMFPKASGLGIDSSVGALRVARRNAERLELDGRAVFQHGDWCRGLKGAFDLIVANPPYIPEGQGLPGDVREFDPPEALFAGVDGLDAYRTILPDIPGLLAPGGLMVCESSPNQTTALAALSRAFGLASFSPTSASGGALHPVQQVGVLLNRVAI